MTRLTWMVVAAAAVGLSYGAALAQPERGPGRERDRQEMQRGPERGPREDIGRGGKMTAQSADARHSVGRGMTDGRSAAAGRPQLRVVHRAPPEARERIMNHLRDAS